MFFLLEQGEERYRVKIQRILAKELMREKKKKSSSTNENRNIEPGMKTRNNRYKIEGNTAECIRKRKKRKKRIKRIKNRKKKYDIIDIPHLYLISISFFFIPF